MGGNMRAAFDISPGLAQFFGPDVIQRPVQVAIQIKLKMRLERQPQYVAGHRDVDHFDDVLADPAAQ